MSAQFTLTTHAEQVEGSGAPGAADGAPVAPVRRRRRPATNLGTALSIAYIAVVILMAIFAPLIVRVSGWSPYEFDQGAIDPALGGMPAGGRGGISAEHWFGVEPGSGRDIFARIVYGARVSMSIALSATALTTAIGVVMGVLAGYFGGRVDQAHLPGDGLPDGLPGADLHDRDSLGAARR